MVPQSIAPGITLREQVLAAARRRFMAGGLEALAVRAIADEAGCTTMAVYTHFGGKDGLVQLFFDEGFERLAEAQRGVPASLAPIERGVALCRAYRAVAHAYPHHYDLMLGARSGQFTPAPESRRRALATIEHLVDVLEPLHAGASAARRAATDHAHAVIAFCHGWVALERAGLFAPDANRDAAFERGAEAVVAGGIAPRPTAGAPGRPRTR
ncbi:MAG: TetR/AcrR family transcriptional regulator [Gemmatimonadaceae bacterium]|jgi:AcrR family transcriptional regulator|nr:TetR/AcrR family transcriptional regulator [Gemmatimonadaceae bacterium]